MQRYETIPEALFGQAAGPRGGDVFTTVWSNAKGIERRLTFKEFADAVATGAASWVHQVGFEPSERIALLSKGTLDFYVALVSLQAAGMTPVLLNWQQAPQMLAAMIGDVCATGLALGAPYLDLGSDLAGTVRVVVSIDADFKDRRFRHWTWKTTGGCAWPQHVGSRSSEAAIFFTTGSTSRPKPVLHTHETLLWTAEHFVFPTTTSEKMVTTLCFMPNFHVLMCFQNFLLPLVRGVGASIHGADATDVITPSLLLHAVADLNPTTIDTVPFILNEWSLLPPSELKELTLCAAVRSGGAPLSSAVAARLVDGAGIRVQTHYGQTEAPGMQLLTVPGAGSDELAIFAPPWECTIVRLEETTGELLIKGCGGSSPGYLKNGVLAANSSRMDTQGWHHTGDVFKRVKTRLGGHGLQFASRLDDVILLSTGEMFNPVPIEAEIDNFARRNGIHLSRLAVLGQQHPAPFLVVESAATDVSEEDVAHRLWPGVQKANQMHVEYARIRKGHLLVLGNGDSMPHSAKGNVIRPKAEVQFSERLSQLAEEAASRGVDWSALELAAQKAGFGSDVDAYLAQSGLNADEMTLFGLDSLGIRSVTNRSIIEAERIGDNVKAWTVTCIVMVHWYSPVWIQDGAQGVGALQNFYLAPVAGKYHAVSWGVQYFVNVASFINSVFRDDGPTSSLSLLVFVMGYIDGIRDGKARMIKFSRREPSLVVLIIFMKLVVFLIAAYAYDNMWKPDCIYFVGPSNIVWFLYCLVIYRVWTWLFQRVPIPSRFVPLARALAVLGSYVWLILKNFNRNASQFTSNTPYLPGWINVAMNVIFDTGAYIMGSNIKGGVSSDALAFWPKNTKGYVYTYLQTSKTLGKQITDFIVWNDGKLFLLLGPWLFGYFYGQAIIDKCRRAIPAWCNRNTLCFVCVLAAFFTNWIVGTIDITWVGRGTPAPFAPHMNRIYPKDRPDWPPLTPRLIWEPSPSGNRRDGIIAWNPMWARAFYLIYDILANYLIAFFMLIACVAVPWRASRCGNAALGKYILMQSWPTGFFIWLIALVSALGRYGGSDWLIIQVTQIVLLIGYPFFFVYFIGPFFTAVVILIPKFVLWLCYDAVCSPSEARLDAKAFILDAPKNFRAWFEHYFGEVQRDLRALRNALASLGGTLNTLPNLARDYFRPQAAAAHTGNKVRPNDYGAIKHPDMQSPV